jgi:PAS domain S-box-containing protein
MKSPHLSLAARVVLVYAAAGGLWILLSDRVAAAIFPDPARRTVVQTYQGWLFVLVTGLILFVYLASRDKAREATGKNYSNLFVYSVEGIFQSTPEGRYLSVNPAMAEIYGYDSPEEMISLVTDIGTQIHVDQETRKKFIEALLDEGAVEKFEAQNLRKDGSIIWTSTNARIVRDQDGSPLHFEGFVTDITERKRSEVAQGALFQIAYAAISAPTLEDLYRSIHQALAVAMPAKNFYIAQYDADKNLLSFPYFVDEHDQPSPPAPPGRGLTEYVLRTRAPLLASPQVFEELERSGEVDLVGAPSLDWLGVPLIVGLKTIGVMVVQTYEPGTRYGQRELEIMRFVSSQVATAIQRKRAEETLTSSEERYRTLIEQASDGIFITDTDGNYKEVNSSGCGMLGYNREEILRLNLRDLIVPAEAQAHPLQTQGIKEGKTVITQRALRRKDGSLFAAEISSKLLPNGRILGIVRDITERIQAEEVRLEEQKRFRALIENSMDAIALYTADANILYQSPAVKKILGYKPEEVYGMNASYFIHPDDVDRLGEAYQKVLDSPSETVRVEARTRHKDGSYRWLEVIVSNKLNEPGIQALVANYRDITERKEAEKVLQESEEQYRRLVEHSPYTVAIHSEGTLVYLNEAGARLMRAKSAEELYGLPVIEFVHPRSRPGVLQRLEELKQGKEAPPMEEKFLRRDGTAVDVEVTAYPFTYQGKPAVQVVIRDLTAQKEAEKAVRASEERFSKAFHASPIPTCITTLNQGRYLDVNDAYLKLSKREREEILGHTADELRIYKDAEGREAFIGKLINKQITPGQEAKFIAATGEAFDVAAFYELIEIGGETCIISMFHDMTEQKRAQEVIRASEERLRAIVDNTLNIYYTHTPDHMLTYVSAQIRNILGYEPEEALIKWQEFLTDHPVNQRGLMLTQKAIETGQPQESYVLELKAKDGKHKWVEVRETPVVRDGKTVAIVGALTDISERREAEASLERHLAELTVLHTIAIAGSQGKTEDEVIERTTQIVHGVLYPDNCGVLLLNTDGKTLRPHPSYRGAPAQTVAEAFPLSQGITGRVATSGQAARIHDVKKDPDYIETTVGVCSELCVPIRVTEKIIGVFNAESRKPGAFDEEDERLMNTIAGTLGTAIERIRLFQVEQKQRRIAEHLREAAAALTSTLKLPDLYETILASLRSIVQFDSASIGLEKDGEMEIVAGQGFPEGVQVVGKRFPSPKASEFTKNPDPHVVQDAQLEPDFEKWDKTNYIRGWMEIPMIVEDSVIGFLNVDSRQPSTYTQEDAAVAQTFANQAAIAIKNALLYKSEQRRHQEAEKLRQAAMVVASSLNLKEVLDLLLKALKDVVPYDSASVLLPEGEQVRLVAAHGLPDQDQAIGQLFPASNQLLQHVLKTRQSLILEDAQKDERFERWAAAEHVHGWMGVPMIARDEVVGFITLDSLSPATYSPSTAVLAQSFAHQAAIAVENAQLFENLQKSNLELSLAYDITLEGWGNALELRDKETQGHTRRVSELTVKLARRMGCSPEEVIQIRRGVLVHDIGKMAVSDRILHKKGPLTKREWEEMRKHPQYALDLLYPITYLRPALDIPYCHHERWNGTGYPRGLKGEQIPLAARIFAVVDVWDALLYDRPYRKAWAKQKAEKYIREEAGRYFDPHVVDIFLKMIHSKDKR